MVYTNIAEIVFKGTNKMARKKGPPVVEISRKASDGRFIDPKDVRIQEKRLGKALSKLRSLK